MNLEKNQACQNIQRKICSETQGITDLTKINTAIFDFYANLFNNFLNDLSIRSLSETQKQIFEEELTEKYIYESMISFDNNKSPGNDGLTKKFLSDILARCKRHLFQLIAGIQTIKIHAYITTPSNY